MEIFYSVYFFIFGLLIGSFLNVVILRLPMKKDLVKTRSACTNCGTKLKWYHNMPLFSFLFLRGKCGFCGARISWRYPLVEFLTGLIAFWLMPKSMNMETISYFIYFFIIACVFICHFFIDLDHHLLLDTLNIYLLMVILPFVAIQFPWHHWVIGGAMGFGAPLLVTWLFYKIRGQVGLGGGDIKLYGILGLYLGPTGIMFTIFLSCFVGALWGIGMIATKRLTKDRPMAFGPSILLVASFQIFFPELSHKLQALML
ncbi:MAG TPA: prepilin peptidase [Bacteriovoracaceae bacterium]|nr:prepilin peptidase [Bacteriovoracaceae bacterium]